MRRFGPVLLFAIVACARRHDETAVPAQPTTTVTTVRGVRAAPSVSTSASPLPSASAPAPVGASTTPLDAEASRQLEQIRRAAAICARNASAPDCDLGRRQAREYTLMHCASDGVDPAYTFAWAASEPLPDSTVYTDENGVKWYVEAARSPKLARVDERIWSESGWESVEPYLRFESDYPSATEAKRLAALDARISAKTKAAGIVRAVFYEGELVGAFAFHVPITSRNDGGMLYNFYGSGAKAKAHKLCKAPQARVLTADLEAFAGTWSRIH